VRKLRAAGLRVDEGVLAEEALDMNRDFNYWVVKKMPYAALKIAQSLDGRIATRTGDSKWITGVEARHFGHSLRAAADAVLVGVNTVLADDPRLDARVPGNQRHPIKVIVDSTLRTPVRAKLFGGTAPVLIAVTKKAAAARIARFKGKAAVIVVKERAGRVDLEDLFRELGARGVVRVLIEGGGEVAAAAFERKLVRETYTFIAPKIIGGRDAVPAVGGKGAAFVKDAFSVKNIEVIRLGEDLLLWGRL
jgi:diaminohydroxyphosphoribosylaminopyrimidine deaminase/5-amino-6-(5-phosphoribosylamino)uracil reductase